MPEEQNGSQVLKDFLRFLCSLRKLSNDDFNTRVSLYFNDASRTTRDYKEKFSGDLRSVFFTHSLTDAGINSNLGFFPELKQRIKHRILPPINEDEFLSTFVAESFLKKDDFEGIARPKDRIHIKITCAKAWFTLGKNPKFPNFPIPKFPNPYKVFNNQ